MISSWKIASGFRVPFLSSKHTLSGDCLKTDASFAVPCCTLRTQDIEIETQELQFQPKLKYDKHASVAGEHRKTQEDGKPGIVPESFVRGGGGEGVSGIQVPRQRYISISKSGLWDAIVTMFESQEEIDQFLLLSSCLDAILHAEHKSILEEMRSDYNLHHSVEKKGTSPDGLACSERNPVKKENNPAATVENTIATGSMAQSTEDKTVPDMPIASSFSLDLRYILGSSAKKVRRNSSKESRVAVATRFQRAFVQLLYNAQFEELSARDLMLTSALNSDYLLTLPIYVDWKRAYESNAIIFRRGYATERQKGLLVVEKLDYLQSKLLQEIFFIISKPLGKVSAWITKALTNANMVQDIHAWTERLKLWLTELILFQQSNSYSDQTADNLLDVSQVLDDDLPIWLAAQKAVTRYEGILSPVGPRSRLLRKLLTWIGLIPFTPRKPFELDADVTACEPYLRPISLSRITLSDIWEPATRKCCGNDLWKIFKSGVSILFSKSILQEPAFQELILLFTKERDQGETEDKTEVPSLQLKIYERIPIPDLPVIFPHKKLSFRILDTVRLDAARLLGLLAYFINYKFEDILSSPSAILLDVIAISALIIYVIRVALGYKQTWNRYQLLVNKTLYEKTLASGFGTVHFLLDASEQQQYKESILAYAILLNTQTSQAACPKNVKDKCERFMYNMFKERVEMPVDKAVDTLKRLGLVVEKVIDQKIRLQAIPCSEAYDILKQHWDSLLS